MQHSMPPLSALRAFEATARLGSVTAAADELSVTHGAISRQLKSLDEHFGVALFAKAGRGIVLTMHGERLLSGVGEAFLRLKDSCAALKREVEDVPFTLACPGSLLARWLIPRLDRLHRDLPDLKLKVVVSESEQPGKQTDASATLAFSEPPWPADVDVVELIPEQICAVVSPQLAAQCDPAEGDGSLRPGDRVVGPSTDSGVVPAAGLPDEWGAVGDGAGEERAVVKNGELKVANVMSVTLSTDHRAVDGALGAELLAAFKRLIENPMGMLV